MLAGVLWIYLFQRDPVRTPETLAMLSDAATRAYEARRKENSEQDRLDFERKFNKLIDALHDFARDYRGSEGHVWPPRKVEAIQKAFRELERTTIWKQSGKLK